MCGIVGFWQPARLPGNAAQILARMMARLHHRGPDGSGSHLQHERGLAMGHTRLTVIDLKTGAQPLFSSDRRLVMTTNGELYDYKKIRAEYVCEGQRFDTKSDSETALFHYLRHGLDFVERLRGEFAIALFDETERRMLLVRDRFGVKPVYYHSQDGLFVYGSECKALLAHPDVPRAINKRSALNQMMQVTVPGTTSFEGIQALEPGCMLIVQEQAGRLVSRVHRYWDMDFPDAKEHDPRPDPQTYIRGVQDKLVDAVSVRLEADVPVGCYLSGGIDSCSMLGLATALQQSPVKAFTISFDNKAYDESAIATEMAMSAGADQELLELGADELYGDSYVRTVWHAERTFYNTLGVAKWHMSKRVRECGYKVVVTGEGSDELFGGYPFFKRDMFRHAPEFAGSGEAAEARLAKQNAVFSGSILSEQSPTHPAFEELVGFTPSWLQGWLLTLAQARPLFTDGVLEELRDYDPVTAIAERIDKRKLDGRHVLDKAQYTWIKTMLEGQILTWGGDRVDMANSMESRPAFLDQHVAEFARTIPPSLRISEQGVEKWVLREAMRGVLPQVLYEREKFAFMAPPAHTDRRKRAAIERMLGDHLTPEHIRAAGLLDPARVATFLDNWRGEQDHARATRNDILLNHILGLHLIQQELVDRAAS